MPCVHLKELYKLCQENEIKIGGLDIVRLTCNQCKVKDVCPSVLYDQFDDGGNRHDSDDSAIENLTSK